MNKPTRFEIDPVRERQLDRAVLVGVDRGGRGWDVSESLAELARLTETAGAEIVGTITQKLHSPDPRTFIGKGKAEEVADLVRSTGATLVVFDEDLTPSQQANLEGLITETKIADRTALILDIFALHATTREGKLQVELAQLEYLLPRLRGLWRHLDRFAGGGVLTRGPGESQLETDRRLARRRISDLKRELKHVAGERHLQRKSRARSGIFRVSLVGYTNAGKSTLLNALTGSEVLVADKLFATLDATTRTLDLPEGRKVTLTDTVGFINKLPHSLVEAFKSTLDEVREADLLLHVVDASHPQSREQVAAVCEVLGEIGAARSPQLLVFNKIDRLEAADKLALRAKNPSAALVSAFTGQGLDDLRARVSSEAARTSITMTLVLPYDRGDLVTIAHEHGQIVSVEHIESGTRMVARIPVRLAERFRDFEGGAIDGEGPPEDTERSGDTHEARS